jgi:nicotinic acid mononucleotide adenylyltransferase
VTDSVDELADHKASSRGWIVQIPPGSFVVFGNDPVEQLIAVPLWLKWCQIAVREAKLALEARPRDAQIDMMSAKLAHVDQPEVDWSSTTVDDRRRAGQLYGRHCRRSISHRWLLRKCQVGDDGT